LCNSSCITTKKQKSIPIFTLKISYVLAGGFLVNQTTNAIVRQKTTYSKITEEINALLNGNSNRPYPLSVAEIAKVLKISRKTVYNYINKIPKQESIARLPSGHFALSKNLDSKYRHFNKHHDITSDPLVTEWMDDLLTRKQGSPIKSWRKRLLAIETVCNTCKVNPKELIVSRKNTEKIMRSFAKHYHNGNVKQSLIGKKSEGMGFAIYIRVQGIRDFCAFYDITWRKGISGVMSQKVPSHGKYADIRLTDEEFVIADNFIKEQWGMDSDIYRWFWIGIESCARFNALYSMSNQYSKHQSPSGKTIYIMTAFETKTEQISWYQIMAAGIMILGIYLVSRKDTVISPV